MSVLHHAPPSKGGRRIFIAIPSYGSLPALTAFSLFESYPALAAAGIEVELYILCGHCHLDDARCLCVAKFLESDADELMFIDADIGWQAADLARFAQHDRDIVAGVYRKKSDEEEYPCQLLPGEIWSDSDGLIEVNAVPTGFLKIRRSVLDRMVEDCTNFRPDAEQDRSVPQVFYRHINEDGARVSADYHFCHRWRSMGGRIFVDPELVLEHVGERRWDGSFGTYLRRQYGLDLTVWIDKIRSGTFERRDLIPLWQEWGGNQWAAGHELLAAGLDVARQAKGPIIETGSGLSSLVMAATGAEVHSLEHDPVWLSRVVADRDRLGLDSLHIHYAPLVDGWYSNYSKLPWSTCDVVLCDGPPRQLGKRDRLLDVMRDEGCAPRLMLKDDAGSMSTRMPDGYTVEIMGQLRQFAVGKRKRAEAA